jgi:hypothetical protein
MAAMAIFSSYYWSGFPFDNLCENDEEVPEAYLGYHTIQKFKNTTSLTALALTGDLANATTLEFDGWINTTVSPGDKSYRYCNQDFLRTEGRFTFPFVGSFQEEGDEWMTEGGFAANTVSVWNAVLCFWHDLLTIPSSTLASFIPLDQELVTTIYGWSACVFLLLFVVMLIWIWTKSIYGYFKGSYEVRLLIGI